MRVLWQAVDGEVRIPLDQAEWWGAALAVLVAAVHHPGVLAARQPDTDPAEVAREALAVLCELQAAATCADAQALGDEVEDAPRSSPSVRREEDEVVFSPGGEVANLALCVLIFSTAVLEPRSPEATIARGATAYAASAWSHDIGKATGAL